MERPWLWFVSTASDVFTSLDVVTARQMRDENIRGCTMSLIIGHQDIHGCSELSYGSFEYTHGYAVAHSSTAGRRARGSPGSHAAVGAD